MKRTKVRYQVDLNELLALCFQRYIRYPVENNQSLKIKEQIEKIIKRLEKKESFEELLAYYKNFNKEKI